MGKNIVVCGMFKSLSTYRMDGRKGEGEEKKDKMQQNAAEAGEKERAMSGM